MFHVNHTKYKEEEAEEKEEESSSNIDVHFVTKEKESIIERWRNKKWDSHMVSILLVY